MKLRLENDKMLVASICSILMLGVMLFAGTRQAEAVDCRVIVKDLNKQIDKIHSSGGIWSLFERTDDLKAQSMLGMQADSKLQRTVSNFETFCKEEPQKATVDLAKQIADLLDNGIKINNGDNGAPSKQILADVEALNQSLDQLLAQIEK